MQVGVPAIAVDSKNGASVGANFATNPYCEDIKDPIDKFACWTEQAVEGIKLRSIKLSSISLSQREVSAFKAIEAMNLVQNTAGAGRHHFFKAQKGYVQPTMDEQSSLLTKGIGICGNHQHLFVEILKRAGVDARPVDFYYTDKSGKRQSHAAAEVKIGEKWIYFDITWGSFWVIKNNDLSTLMPLDEVLKGGGTRIGGNNSWYLLYEKEGINSFEYFEANDLQILRNKGGDLLVGINNGAANFSHIPNYVGKTEENFPLSMTLTGSFEPSAAVLDIAGVGGGCEASRILVGEDSYPVVTGETQIRIVPNSIIEVEGQDAICYAVISSLRLVKQ